MTDEIQSSTITFRLSTRDMYFALVHITLKKLWVGLMGPISGLFILGTAYFAPGQYSSDATSGYLAIGFGVILFLIVPYLQTRTVLKNPNFAGQLVYSASADGLTTQGDHASGRMDWSMIKRVTENSKYVFIQGIQGMFCIIPKTQVPTNELAAFKRVLSAYAPGRLRSS